MQPLIRGHMVQYTGRFITEDPVLSRRMPPAIMERIKRNQAIVKMPDWCPREDLTSLWSAIAEAVEPRDDANVYQTLVRCGEMIGGYATTTFLKLLLKVLTPKMFANKFPDFYKRDHQNSGEGQVEEIGPNRVVLLARGVAGYDHFGPITVGWSAVPLRGMGLKNVNMTCSPWSIAEPGPPEVRFIASWD